MEYQKKCKIHGVLQSENIVVENNKTAKRGFTLRCKICKRDKEQRYKEAHREELCEKNKIYKAQNRHIVNAWEREDRKLNPDKYRKYEANYIAKHGIEKVRKMEVARIHGLTISEYDLMFERQNHLCLICNNPETRLGKDGKTITPLAVDHCHYCEEKGAHMIRGLLCRSCNQMLGMAKDDITLLQKAIEYLKRHEHTG